MNWYRYNKDTVQEEGSHYLSAFAFKFVFYSRSDEEVVFLVKWNVLIPDNIKQKLLWKMFLYSGPLQIYKLNSQLAF